MTDVDAASDKSFRSDLNAFLNTEEDDERRSELIGKLAHHLMKEGEEFYPWTFQHFEEALGNSPADEREVFWLAIVDVAKTGGQDNLVNRFALEIMQLMVEDYWRHLAKFEAQKRVSRTW